MHSTDQRPPGARDESAIRCPFMGQAVVNTTFICLSDDEPVAVSRRYGDSYCLTDQYMKCSLYLAAVLAGRGSGLRPPSDALPAIEVPATDIVEERVERVPPVPSKPGRDAAASGALPITDGKPAELAPMTSREGRAQAIAIAANLQALIAGLDEHVRTRHASNAELERRIRMLEEMVGNEAFLRRILDTGHGATGEGETAGPAILEIAALQAVLQAVLTNPSNLEALIGLAQQRDTLTQLVEVYAHISRLVDGE